MALDGVLSGGRLPMAPALWACSGIGWECVRRPQHAAWNGAGVTRWEPLVFLLMPVTC